MRKIGLWAYGFLLLVLSGALCRVLHLEWVRPDPTLILVVYVGLILSADEGLFFTFTLGVVSDSLAAAPLGMLTTGYVLTWAVVRGIRRVLLPERLLVQLAILFGMAIFFGVWMILVVVFAEEGGGPVWLMAKAALPLAILNLALAYPVWALAKRILRPGPRQVIAAAR